MNLDELEEAHRKLNAYDEPFVGHELQRCAGLINRAFPALLALARDGERYRWLRDEADPDSEHPYVTIHTSNDWGKWFNTIEQGKSLDAAIDAAMKERT